MSNELIEETRSKARINEIGEVFTPKNTVLSMLELKIDLVKNIKSVILEPSCGSGNFLVEILKVRLVENDFSNTEEYILNAVSSLYGIDIMPDNITETRKRLLNIITEHNSSLDEQIIRVIRFILEKNIILGDTLSNRALKVVGNRAKNKATKDAGDIVLYTWEFNDNTVSVRAFTLENMDMEIWSISDLDVKSIGNETIKV